MTEQTRARVALLLVGVVYICFLGSASHWIAYYLQDAEALAILWLYCSAGRTTATIIHATLIAASAFACGAAWYREFDKNSIHCSIGSVVLAFWGTVALAGLLAAILDNRGVWFSVAFDQVVPDPASGLIPLNLYEPKMWPALAFAIPVFLMSFLMIRFSAQARASRSSWALPYVALIAAVAVMTLMLTDACEKYPEEDSWYFVYILTGYGHAKLLAHSVLEWVIAVAVTALVLRQIGPGGPAH